MQPGVNAVYRWVDKPACKKIFLFLVLCYVALPQNVFSSDVPAGRLTVVTGEVACKRPAAGKVTTAVGDRIFVGDVLETGKDSGTQVVLTDDSVITLAAGTAVRVNQYTYETETNRRTAVVKVLKGRARIIVYKERHKESAFTVETAHAVATFGYADLVVTSSDAETSLAVLDGGVSVKNLSYLTVGEVRVGTNQQTVVKKGTPPLVPSSITEQQRRIFSKDARHF